ncbi:hypothetical protein AAHA92_13693 [Salvia divinorum]|uniref:Uncharacterized protein n=1 Tax=Salvia divinorum TaxID=28513 RepID=A0ABD1H946_SALDI
MATVILPLILLLSFLIATASARPCKTLFYFSAATTTTYYPSNSLNPNPNGPNSAQYVTLIFTSTTTTSSTASPRFRNRHFDRFNELSKSLRSESPVKLYSSDSSSAIAMDILSVVVALLFSTGCGAVMYSLWSLFIPRHFDFDELSSSSDDDDDYDDFAKKIGYVAIPAQGKLIDDDLAKEVV